MLSALLLSNTLLAAVDIRQTAGWFESGCVTWSPVSGASDYHVYVASQGSSSWQALDQNLVRQYPGYYRADAVGLKAGSYKFKVVPVVAGTEKLELASESQFTAAAHDRSGFAHVGMPEGIGAYKNDGTLKENAKVIYVWGDNASTITTTVITTSKGATTSFTGLQHIIGAYEKGYDKTPLDIRIIGTIKKEDLDEIGSKEEGLQVKGRASYADMPITIEGIGNDAAIYGFGILVRNCHGTEFRNFAIMRCMDDCISIDTDNSNVWIHNMDFFYGQPGSDSDQAKGDGTVDIKSMSKNVTVSYNHFYDSGKCSLGGMKPETSQAWHTYHHNWFDHSDSRHPRIRQQFFHVYNNYFDGNSKYGIGAAKGGTAFVEANYFRNCLYPMLSSQQGTDGEGDGTFSGEEGGVIKAYNNVIINPRKLQYNSGAMTDGKWDAVLAKSRDAVVDAKALVGGEGYNNDADLAARTTYIENKMDAPNDVPAVVKGELGAGRMQHGDFSWRFLNSAQDANSDVVSSLSKALADYKSMLVGFANGTAIRNGGATSPFSGGDGASVSDAANDAFVPSWGHGLVLLDGVAIGGDIPADNPSEPVNEIAVIGSDKDYFWFNELNKDRVNNLYASGVIDGGTFAPQQVVSSSDGTLFSDRTGSIRVAKSSSLTFYNEDGITKLDLYVSGNGSMEWQYAISNDGESFTNLGGSVTASKGSHPTLIAQPSNPAKYVRLINLATGNRDVQGVKLYKQSGQGEPEPEPELLTSDLTAVTKSIELTVGDSRQLSIGDYTTSSTGAIVYASSASGVATVSPSGLITAVAAGNAKITVSQAEDAAYKAGVIEIALVVKAAEITPDPEEPEDPENPEPVSSEEVICYVEKSSTYNLSSAMVKLKSGSYSNSKGSVTYAGNAYGNCIKMESATSVEIKPSFDCLVTLVFDAASKRISIDGKTYSTDGNGMYAFKAKAGTTYALKKGDVLNLFLVIFTPTFTAEISQVGYSTLYLENNSEVPEGLEVYAPQMSADGRTMILVDVLESGNVLPAQTGFVIKGEKGKYVFYPSRANAVEAESCLSGSLKEMPVSNVTQGKVLVLGAHDGKVGFYSFTGTMLAANKCYLVYDEARFGAAPIRLLFEEEETETSIAVVDKVASSGAIYNLQGQRMDSIKAPGRYIVGGKLIFVK